LHGMYKAGPGWDACSGLGVPNGMALQDLLAA
jgi:kumamolisin